MRTEGNVPYIILNILSISHSHLVLNAIVKHVRGNITLHLLSLSSATYNVFFFHAHPICKMIGMPLTFFYFFQSRKKHVYYESASPTLPTIIFVCIFNGATEWCNSWSSQGGGILTLSAKYVKRVLLLSISNSYIVGGGRSIEIFLDSCHVELGTQTTTLGIACWYIRQFNIWFYQHW